jgi:hypothetical protein
LALHYLFGRLSSSGRSVSTVIVLAGKFREAFLPDDVTAMIDANIAGAAKLTDHAICTLCLSKCGEWLHSHAAFCYDDKLIHW